MSAEEQNRATGSGGRGSKIIDVEESGSGGLLAGFHLTPPDPCDPTSSLQQLFGELQGIANSTWNGTVDWTDGCRQLS